MSRKSKGKGTVPVQDLGLNKLPTPEELRSYCQARTLEDGADPMTPHGIPIPQHGEVKVYTEEEIAEYEKQRDWIMEDAEYRLKKELEDDSSD